MDISKVKLNNGVKMPMFGLGVYDIKPRNTSTVLQWAFNIGYRLIDTARLYGNEKEVGEAVRNCDIPREELFITTKLWNNDHGYDKALTAFDKSLERTGLDYLDLYLIHWPVANLRLETWNALESLLETERVKAIGVSNYMIPHLVELMEHSNIIPAINQVEFHPWLFRRELLEFCKEKKIQLEAYSPLTKGRKLKDPLLINIASKYAKTPAQILIKWVLEHKIIVIPKSEDQKHLNENIDIFDFTISSDDINTLNSLDEGFVVSWDPRNIP